MICRKCNYEEHTCTNCDLTEEQEWYLRSLCICSKCYSKSGLSAKYEEHSSEAHEWNSEFTAKCKKELFDASKVKDNE